MHFVAVAVGTTSLIRFRAADGDNVQPFYNEPTGPSGNGENDGWVGFGGGALNAGDAGLLPGEVVYVGTTLGGEDEAVSGYYIPPLIHSAYRPCSVKTLYVV